MKHAAAVTLSLLLLTGGAYACCGHCGMGTGAGGHTPGVVPGTPAQSAAVQPDPASTRKSIDGQIAYLRKTMQLRTDLAVSQLELQGLWLDGNPDAAKLSAKLMEILELQRKLDGVPGGWGSGGHMGMMRGCGMMGGTAPGTWRSMGCRWGMHCW